MPGQECRPAVAALRVSGLPLAGVAWFIASMCVLTYWLYFPFAFMALTAVMKSSFSARVSALTFLRPSLLGPPRRRRQPRRAPAQRPFSGYEMRGRNR